MPDMGIPPSTLKNQYKDIVMAPKESPKKGQDSGGGKAFNRELLDKINGGRNEDLYQKAPKNQLGKDDFVNLLTFQMKNQDPFKPKDQAQFISELAQFSQLERLSNIQKTLDKQNTNVGAEQKFLAASFIGKKVFTKGDTIHLDAKKEKPQVHFKLDTEASRVLVRIFDEKGSMVKQVELEDLPIGPHKITWDGMRMDGQKAKNASYRVSLLAFAKDGGPFDAQTQVAGEVKGVSFGPLGAQLDVDGRKVFLKDIDVILKGDNEEKTPMAQQEKVFKGLEAKANGPKKGSS